MLRCALFLLLLQLVLAKDKEKEIKHLTESVAAASIVRARGEYNSSSTCVWPDCAPTCEGCGTKAMGTCMIPGVNMCPWSSVCLIGTCFCSKGYCGQESECKFRICELGAQPAPYVPGDLVSGFASLGGEAPPYNAKEEDWIAFAESGKKLPLFVLAIGFLMGIMTCTCILCQLECEFSWLPTSPVVLLALCGITVAVILLGVVSRGMVVTTNMDLMETQFRRVDRSIDKARDLAEELKGIVLSFEGAVNALPDSCQAMVPGAKEAMGMAAEKANEELTEMQEKVDSFERVAGAAKTAMVTLLESFDVVKMAVIFVPMVPLILMGLWTLAIAVATIISWQSSNPHVAERADDLVIRFGTCGACCNILVATMLSASYLYVGILAGGFCTNLDANVISLVHAVNFTKLSSFPVNIDPVLEGAAKYYILGNQENPIHALIEDVQRDAVALHSVYTNASWVVKPAEMVCSGVANLNVSDALDACKKCVGFVKELMSARQIYPYYDTFARELMCDKMLHSMRLLIIFTMVVSIFLMPMVALFADVDLRKWERYKMDNYENHYDMSYESHEASPFLGKSGMQMPQMPHIPMPQMSRKPGQLPSPAASREMQLGHRGR